MSWPDVGKLINLPIADIRYSQRSQKCPNFIIQGSIEALNKTSNRNWLPLMVRQIDMYSYEVIHNEFVYEIALEAGLERIWCLVTDDSDEVEASIKILARDKAPKININNASEDLICEALEYLRGQPNSPIQKINLKDAVQKIFSADRRYWKNLMPITKLKCGIGRGKKLDLLHEIFYLNPQTPPPPPSQISIKKCEHSDILLRLQYLASERIAEMENNDISYLANAIYELDTSRWKTINPLSRADLGLTAKQIKAMKNLFCG